MTRRSKTKKTFTYRHGKKVQLDTQPNEIVVRALPEQMRRMGVADEELEQVSSRSTRVRVKPAALEKTLKEMRKVVPTHRSYRRADTGVEFLITDRVFVTFKQAPTEEQLGDFTADYALLLLDRYSATDFLFQLTDHTGMSPVDLVVTLTEEEPRVDMAEHDLNQRATKAIVPPTDPHYQCQWFLHSRSTDSAVDARASARCEQAWLRLGNFGSAAVVVGVTDDGCRLDHADFSDAKFPGWGYFDGRRLVRKEDVDAIADDMYEIGEDHGTSCAGVIAGEADGTLTVGAAPNVKVLPIKWEILDDGSLSVTDSKMLTVLGYVGDKVDVLSNSWSSTPDTEWATPVLTRMRNLARTGGRRGKGILFLWAAGNENCPISHAGNKNIPYTDGWEYREDDSRVWVGPETSKRFINNLVGLPAVAHVAALASTAQRSHYSNYGTGITLCAPSSNSHAFDRDVVHGVAITTVSGRPSRVTHDFGGTSSATPLVAGIAALVISANPELSAEEVLSVLKRTASKNLDTTGYRRTPATSYDPTPTWDISPVAPFNQPAFTDVGDPDGTWSPWFGHGRVDALDAVVDALRRVAGGNGAAHSPVQLSSSPNTPIPDDDNDGIRDVLHVDESGHLEWIEVHVEIDHTYIGDLYVRLVTPDGTTAVLHNRSGGKADDLRKTYDSDTRNSLRNLIGKEIQGDWVLEVSDREKVDTGILESWRLVLLREGGVPVAIDVAGVQIPDGNAGGILRSLVLPPGPAIRKIKVGVEITHPWVRDLVLELLPPTGASIALPIGTAPSGPRFTWSDDNLAALAAQRGRDPGGEWKLKVADTAQLDSGTLDEWSLEVTG